MTPSPGKFTIVEFDKDYKVVTGTAVKKFNSLEEAEEYCKKESWSGYYYFVENLNDSR